MTFKAIEYVLAIWEEGSFVRAAQRLFVSQPALSQRIRGLEEELGAPLFERGPRGLRLTVAGEMLVREGRELVLQRDDLINRLSGLVRGVKETIRLGISPFYSKYYLPVVLPYYSQNFPSVRLEVTEEISVELERRVIDGELDLCFVPMEPQNARLVYELIYAEEILLAIPADHPANAHATPSPGLSYIDLRLMKDEPFIALKSVQKFNDMSLRLCTDAGFQPRIVYETLNWDTVNTLIANGIGVGFLPEILYNASSYVRRPNYYRMTGMSASRPYAVAYRKGTTLSPVARQLVEVFRNNIRRLQSLGDPPVHEHPSFVQNKTGSEAAQGLRASNRKKPS